MLACDANADVFPGRRFFRRPEIPVHLCAQAKLYVRQLFSFVRGTYGINGYLIGHVLSKTETTIRRSGILVFFFRLVVF